MTSSVEFLQLTPTMQPGGVTWQVCNMQKTDGCDSVPPYSKALADLSYNSGEHVFLFQIVGDQTGLDIQFAKNNPLWIQPDTKPTAPGVSPGAQIQQVGKGGNSIFTFLDKNKGDAMTLKYRLNLESKAGNAVTSIDPDIKNGGGSTFYSFTTVELLIGGALLLTLGFFFRPVVMRLFR